MNIKKRRVKIFYSHVSGLCYVIFFLFFLLKKEIEDAKVMYLGVYNRPWNAAGNSFVPWATTDGEHSGVKLWKPDTWSDTLRGHSDYRYWLVVILPFIFDFAFILFVCISLGYGWLDILSSI
jgi:hypothetical protein